VPQLQYTLQWYSDVADQVFNAVLDLDEAGVTVIPITRATEWTNIKASDPTETDYEYIDEDTVYDWSKGLRLVGDLNKKIYVDAYPNFSEYRLQAEYVTRKIMEIPLTTKSDPEPDWRIVPYYTYAPEDAKKTRPIGATGDLFVTVGTNPLDYDHPYVVDALAKASTRDSTTYTHPDVADLRGKDVLDPATYKKTTDPGLTVRHEYEQIYIVKSIEVTNKDAAGLLPDFFYWMDDTSAYWLDELVKSDARIEVTYTDGGAPKPYTPKDLEKMNEIWRNDIFNSVPTDDLGTNPNYLKDDVPFAVKSIIDTFPTTTDTYAKNKNPRITVSYRGAYDYIPTLVYTRPTQLVVTAIDGGVPQADMRIQDNDVGAFNAIALDKLVTAKVTFSAAADTNKTTELEVHIGPTPGADVVTLPIPLPAGWDPATVAGGSDGMPGTDGTNAKLYSNNFYDVSTNVKNNGKDASVRFVYASPDLSASGNRIEVGTRTVRANLSVHFENIQD